MSPSLDSVLASATTPAGVDTLVRRVRNSKRPNAGLAKIAAYAQVVTPLLVDTVLDAERPISALMRNPACSADAVDAAAAHVARWIMSTREPRDVTKAVRSILGAQDFHADRDGARALVGAIASIPRPYAGMWQRGDDRANLVLSLLEEPGTNTLWETDLVAIRIALGWQAYSYSDVIRRTRAHPKVGLTLRLWTTATRGEAPDNIRVLPRLLSGDVDPAVLRAGDEQPGGALAHALALAVRTEPATVAHALFASLLRLDPDLAAETLMTITNDPQRRLPLAIVRELLEADERVVRVAALAALSAIPERELVIAERRASATPLRH